MKTSFRVGSIKGIAIRVHFTLLIIVALFAWTFATQTVDRHWAIQLRSPKSRLCYRKARSKRSAFITLFQAATKS